MAKHVMLPASFVQYTQSMVEEQVSRCFVLENRFGVWRATCVSDGLVGDSSVVACLHSYMDM